jgi:hypothetical protein
MMRDILWIYIRIKDGFCISMRGQYYYGDSAWKYIRDFTGIDLHEMLEQIAESREDRK